MKIVLAHNHFNLIGGAEVFYHEVGRVLIDNGHSVSYFSPLDENIKSEWVNYFPKTADYNSTNLLSNLLSFRKMIYSKEAKKKFKELLIDFQPDIVHVFAIYVRLTPSILEACSELNIPIVMSCNDYKHICPNYKLFHHGKICEACKDGKFYNAFLNKCSKNSFKFSFAIALEAYSNYYTQIYRKNINTYLFASSFMAKKTQEFWGKGNFNFDILKNPFNSQKYSLSTDFENYILYFGRLVDEKGVDILINAMKFCPNSTLKIIGNGTEQENLLSLTKSLNLGNVEFVGPKWGEELEQYIKKARFIVVPSIWHENFPYVILQSFALGKPVIGSNRGGIPEMINDGLFGLIYEANNHIELSEKINFLWENLDLCKKMGFEAKKYLDENYNDIAFYNSIKNIYEKTLQSNKVIKNK
jgi:glycosyltransferase involved in cell wall biosynthesis